MQRSTRLQGKGVAVMFQLFLDPEYCLAPGKEPVTSRPSSANTLLTEIIQSIKSIVFLR